MRECVTRDCACIGAAWTGAVNPLQEAKNAAAWWLSFLVLAAA
jgi:hypothetical protein